MRFAGLQTGRRGSRRGELRRRLRLRPREEGDDAVEPPAGRLERRGHTPRAPGAKVQPRRPGPEHDVLSGNSRAREDEEHQDSTGGGRDRGVPRRRRDGQCRALRRQVQLRRRARRAARRRRAVRVDGGGQRLRSARLRRVAKRRLATHGK
uniref:Uncharacterized protein n=1 Tax=Oryza brachyantha TaxID=4533 RepID=J3MCC3_ORYBR